MGCGVGTQRLVEGVRAFGKSTARMALPPVTQGLGLAVLAQHEGCSIVGAVGPPGERAARARWASARSMVRVAMRRSSSPQVTVYALATIVLYDR